jgi:starvation-inducible DNA-binding protein
MRALHIGLTDEQRRGSIARLDEALANEMLLLIKTKKIHWDVVGPQFLTLHKLLDEQYATLTEFVDTVAERVRTLGGYPVGTAAGFIESATLRESPGKVSDATTAVAILLDDHEAVVRGLREAAERCEVEYGDRGTADFFVAMLRAHEEMAWILRSFTEGSAVQSDGRVDLPRGASHTLA